MKEVDLVQLLDVYARTHDADDVPTIPSTDPDAETWYKCSRCSKTRTTKQTNSVEVPSGVTLGFQIKVCVCARAW